MHASVFTAHHTARTRHEERLARGLTSFAARDPDARRTRLSRRRCPLSRPAAWYVARRRAAAGGAVAV
jgi:hypothetical protein